MTALAVTGYAAATIGLCQLGSTPLSAALTTYMTTNGPAAAGFKARHDGSGEKNSTGDHFSTGFNVGFLLPGRGE